MKEKQCKQCKKQFLPKRPLQYICSIECASQYVRIKKEKELKKQGQIKAREAKEKLTTYSEWLKILQAVFNTYIRLRDERYPCITCGTSKGNIQYHAGHYYSVGASPNLRFNEDNCHKQCATCNNILSGNLIEYTDKLPIRIGFERFEALKASKSEPLKLTIPEIKELINVYKEKIKSLKK
jgi:hypothetical protein